MEVELEGCPQVAVVGSGLPQDSESALRTGCHCNAATGDSPGRDRPGVRRCTVSGQSVNHGRSSSPGTGRGRVAVFMGASERPPATYSHRHRLGIVPARFHLLNSQDSRPSCRIGKDLHEQLHPRTGHSRSRCLRAGGDGGEPCPQPGSSRSRGRGLQPHARPHREAHRSLRLRGRLRARGRPEGFRRLPAHSSRGHHHGSGWSGHRGGHRGARCPYGARRHHRRRRQHALHRHPAP